MSYIKSKTKSLYQSVEQNAIKRINSKSIIWHFCTPKSASTFLTITLDFIINGSAIKGGKTRKFRYYEQAHQPSFLDIYSRSFLSKTKNTFMLHSHTHYTDYLEYNYFSPKHKYICQTRSIYDTLISLYDHITKHYSVSSGSVKSGVFPMLKLRQEEWNGMDKNQRIDILINHYVPWHIDFLMSWLVNKENRNQVHLIQYSEFILDKNKCIYDLFKFCDLDISDSKIEEALEHVSKFPKDKIRKNKGIVNRGKQDLSEYHKDRIKEIVASRDKYFTCKYNKSLTEFL